MKTVQICLRSLFLITCFTITYVLGYSQSANEQPVKSTQIRQTETTWNGNDIQYPVSQSEQITALHIEFAPGAETSWHRHPVASLAYIISGELEVILKDSGETKIFREGDAFAEVIDTWHYGKNVGDQPVKLVVFYIGAKGMQLTEILSETSEE